MKPYSAWVAQANRWAKSVDFGSPMSAWTDAMFAEADAADKAGRPRSMANVRALESKRP